MSRFLREVQKSRREFLMGRPVPPSKYDNEEDILVNGNEEEIAYVRAKLSALEGQEVRWQNHEE